MPRRRKNKKNRECRKGPVEADRNISSSDTTENSSSSSSASQEIFYQILPEVCGRDEEEPKWQALKIDLIWNKIMEFLTYSDLKKLSLVCLYFQSKVKMNKWFQDSSKVMLNSSVLEDPIFSQEPKLIWKHVDIFFDLPMATLVTQNSVQPGVIRERLLHAQSLQISSDHKMCISEQDAEAAVKILLGAIVPSLKSLTLDCVFLTLNLKELLDNPFIRSCFQELNELHISPGGKSELETPGNFKSNMKNLLTIPMKLKKLSWGRIDVSPKTSLLNSYFAVLFVQENRLTLTSLTLELYAWCIEDMAQIICPSLKDLKIHARAKNSNRVNQFLQNQPDLESLEMKFQDEVFESVIQTVAQKSSKLKTFRLKTIDFEDTDVFLRCLNGMSQLEEFGIQMHKNEFYGNEDFSTAQVLNSLPLSVTRLSMSRLCSGRMDRMWDNECLDCPEDEVCTCENDCRCFAFAMAEHNIHRLSRFTHLTHLTIINTSHIPHFFSESESENEIEISLSDDEDNSEDEDHEGESDDKSMVNDQVLQYIIANMSQLKVLRFGHCPTLTDFGITGITQSGEETGLPLSHLTDLEELVIKDCPKLTDDALVKVVKFPGLQSLYFAVREVDDDEDTHENMVSESALVNIVKQNPRLKSIVVHTINDNLGNVLKDAQSTLVTVNNVHNEYCGCILVPRVQGKYFDPYSDDEFGEADEEHYYMDEAEVVAELAED